VSFDEADLVIVASAATGIDAATLLAATDVAELANICASIEAEGRPVEAAAKVFIEVVRRQPFPEHNVPAAWLAATHLLKLAGLDVRVGVHDLSRTLEAIEQGETGTSTVAELLRRAAKPRPRLLGRGLRALFRPGRPGAISASRRCPACGRVLLLDLVEAAHIPGDGSPQARAELTAHCWRRHRVHPSLRHGTAVEPSLAGTEEVPAEADWSPVVIGPTANGDRQLLAFTSSGALVLHPSSDTPEIEVVLVRHLEASQLVGDWRPAVEAGEHLGTVPRDAVRFDADADQIDLGRLLTACS
jgi:prophage maintenance system killer protein